MCFHETLADEYLQSLTKTTLFEIEDKFMWWILVFAFDISNTILKLSGKFDLKNSDLFIVEDCVESLNLLNKNSSARFIIFSD